MHDWLNKKTILDYMSLYYKTCIVSISYKLLYRIKCRTKIVNDVSYVYTVINISDTYNSNISIIGFSYKSFAIQIGLAEESICLILLTIPITIWSIK